MVRSRIKDILRNEEPAWLVLLIIAALMPLQYRYIPPFMILLFVLKITERILHGTTVPPVESRKILLAALFVLFFAWQLTGLLYSDDKRLALSNLSTRLAFLLFPLALCNPGPRIKERGVMLLKLFASCTSLYLVSCFIYAFYRSLSFNGGLVIFDPHPPEYYWINYFYSSDLAYSIHPSYLSMFALLSVFISLEAAHGKSADRLSRAGWILNAFIALVSIYFLSSRAAIMASVILIIFYIANRLFKKEIRGPLLIGCSFSVIILLVLLPRNERFMSFLKSFSSETGVYHKNNDPRVTIWKSTFKLIVKNPVLGVGIGDARNELTGEYKRAGEEALQASRFNAHNQFLEIALESGIIGLIMFLGICGWMIYLAFLYKNLLLGLFMFMMSIFFMFETILYRLAGVEFFALFSFLLLHIESMSGKAVIE